MTREQIRTSRLLLRPWRDEDRAPFAALNADPRVMEHFPSTLTREESDALVDRIQAFWAENGTGLYAVERRDSGAFIGFVGIIPMKPDAPGAGGWEIGWRLAADHWRQGFAKEAASAVRDAVFSGEICPKSERIDRLYSYTSLTNLPSQAVMRAIGLEPWSRATLHSVPVGHALRQAVVYASPRRLTTADGTVLTARRARADDLPLLMALLENDCGCHGEAPGNSAHSADDALQLTFEEIDGDWSHFLAVLEASEETAQPKERSRILGMCQLTVIPGLSRAGAPRMLVDSIHIRRDWRDRGLEALLRKWALEEGHARGVGRIDLLTAHGNTEPSGVLPLEGTHEPLEGAAP